MIVTIIQGLWQEGSKQTQFIVKVFVIKTQINPTTYYIYGSKKIKKPKPSIIVIMIASKKGAHPDHLFYLWQKKKKKNSYWIPFIVNVINDCHNNSRAMTGR